MPSGSRLFDQPSSGPDGAAEILRPRGEFSDSLRAFPGWPDRIITSRASRTLSRGHLPRHGRAQQSP